MIGQNFCKMLERKYNSLTNKTVLFPLKYSKDKVFSFKMVELFYSCTLVDSWHNILKGFKPRYLQVFPRFRTP